MAAKSIKTKGKQQQWPDSVRERAVAHALELGPAEAARVTGVPSSTIRWWLRRHQNASDAPRVRALQERATERAIEEVGEYIAVRLRALSDRLYSLAEKAVGKVELAISDIDELPPGHKLLPRNQEGAAWIRALVGVMAQSLEKGQLLTGQPTARNEDVTRREYQITQQIIAEQPDLLDAVFPVDQRSGVANRGGQGQHPGMGELR